MITEWNVLAVVTIFCLIFFYSGRNAVWVTFAIGFIGSLMIAAALILSGKGFNALLVKKITIVATLIGVVIELITRFMRSRGYQPLRNK